MSLYFAMAQAAFVRAWRLKLRLHDLFQEFVRSEELGLVLAGLKDLTSKLESAHHIFTFFLVLLHQRLQYGNMEDSILKISGQALQA